MIIAQITDLHLGFSGEGNKCENKRRLKHVRRELGSLIAQPDLIILTGDLVENGSVWAYEILQKALRRFDIPICFALGNHDNREAFAEVFGDDNFNGGFLQYTVEDWPLRIIVLDTLEPGRHGGAFCEDRAKWLDAELQKDSRPTLIAMHHPPIETGIAWMTAKDDDAWVVRLKGVISKHAHVTHIISGHIHRTIFQTFAGTTLSVAPAVAPQVNLELAGIDPDNPDGRPLLSATSAGYSLHQWNGKTLTTHTARAPSGKTIVKFDEKHADVVRLTLDAETRASSK